MSPLNGNPGGGNTGGQEPESLQRQLELTRFERALTIAEGMAGRRVLLTTTELARLNQILTGQKPQEDPWRQEVVSLTLPSGRTETFSIVADPKNLTREKLHRATEFAEAGQVVEAATGIYVDLVLSHVFKDANRRTAAVAAHYFMRRYGVPLSGMAIHEIGLGDLREEGQVEALRETLRQMAKFVTKNSR